LILGGLVLGGVGLAMTGTSNDKDIR
jgi:hypothetical protein